MADICANLRERIDEACGQGWLGEVEGLQATLAAAEQKLAAMEEFADRSRLVTLGIPILRQAAGIALS